MARSKKDKTHQTGDFMHREHRDLTDLEDQIIQSHNRLMGADWKSLGELELPVRSGAEQTVQGWVIKTLKPLDLQEELINMVSKSAQGAVTRIIQLESGLNIERIHIILFVPTKHPLKGQFYGFFRLEKTIDPAERAVMPGQMIAFYLYWEGQ